MFGKMNQKELTLSIICLFILILNLITLELHQPVGYVVNMYDLLPFSFYFGSILCYFLSSILLLKFNQKIAVYFLVLLHIEILIIPYIFGYFMMGRADDITYLIGYDNVIKNGLVSNSNIYPASYIIGGVSSLITNVQTNLIGYFLQIYFSFMFIIGMFVFSKKLIDKRIICYIALISSFVFYFGHFHQSLAPHFFFFCMVPFYLFVLTFYLQNKNAAISICSLIFIFLSIYTHPFIFLVVAFIYGLAIIKNQFFDRMKVDLITSFIILNVSFLLWFISNSTFMRKLRQIYIGLMEKSNEAVAMAATDKLSKAGFDVVEFIRFIHIFYGRYVIPTVFIFISLIFFYKNKRKFNNIFSNKYLLLLALYSCLFILQVVLFFNSAVAHVPDRLMNLNFVVFAQIPLFAYSLYIIFLKNNHSNIRLTAVLLVLVIVWSFSLFSCFSSPYTYDTSPAIPNNEITGMAWIENTRMDYPVSMLFGQNRFYVLLEHDSHPSIVIPDHFGYDAQNNSFAKINLDEYSHTYVVINTLTEFLYQEVPGFKKVARYEASDFRKFRSDPSVIHIYDSLDIEIYLSGK